LENTNGYINEKKWIQVDESSICREMTLDGNGIHEFIFV
jgi:hypothetical protein